MDVFVNVVENRVAISIFVDTCTPESSVRVKFVPIRSGWSMLPPDVMMPVDWLSAN